MNCNFVKHYILNAFLCKKHVEEEKAVDVKSVLYSVYSINKCKI